MSTTLTAFPVISAADAKRMMQAARMRRAGWGERIAKQIQSMNTNKLKQKAQQ